MSAADSQIPAVVIPVFNAPRELARCLGTVHASVPGETRVIVIDDASTDAEVRRVLAGWRERVGTDWSFLYNTENLGFVATVNRGMELACGDVVLLNSDTEVTQGWLQGLQRCLGSDTAIATATPWTNNGEIASIPRFCRSNPVPADREAVAAVIARAVRPAYPDLPTAVGFCMAVARRALDRIGGFDASAFGRGYGEENDFSMRARAAGMRNVLCDDVYVVHLGGRSFGPLGLRPGDASMRRLLARHPNYLGRVQAFIRDDPLAPLRGEILHALEQAGLALG